jgi:hypothetical protein
VRRVAGTGLVLAATGIVIQIIGGADYPTVPPGLLILLTAAALVLFGPWRLALGLAMVATLFISVGGVLAPSFRQQLSDPSQLLTFSGSIVQVVGLAVGLLWGAAATREAFRRDVRRTEARAPMS